MKRLLIVILALAVPVAVFAQTPQQREESVLKARFGLTNAQVTQVIDLQKKTADQVRVDAVHLRLLRAELAEALLPSTVDQSKVNDLIDQMSQTRGDMQKAMVGASIQLRQIVGDDAYYALVRFMKQSFSQHRGIRRGAPNGEHGMSHQSGMAGGSFYGMLPGDARPGFPGASGSFGAGPMGGANTQ
jgi:Spy/CpxP family protein refolding chaperone